MAEPSRPIRLLDRVRERLRIKHYSLRTEEAYLYWIRRYIRFFGSKRHPETMGDAELTEFLTHLALDAQVAASTQNQALGPLLLESRSACYATWHGLRSPESSRSS